MEWHSVLEVWLVSDINHYSASWDSMHFQWELSWVLSADESFDSVRHLVSFSLLDCRWGTDYVKHRQTSWQLLLFVHSSVALWHSHPSLNSKYVHYLTKWWPIATHSAKVSRQGSGLVKLAYFSVPLALAMGFLFGLLDGCNNTNR